MKSIEEWADEMNDRWGKFVREPKAPTIENTRILRKQFAADVQADALEEAARIPEQMAEARCPKENRAFESKAARDITLAFRLSATEIRRLKPKGDSDETPDTTPTTDNSNS